MNRRIFTGVTLSALLATVAGQAQAIGYTFTTIVDSTGTYNEFPDTGASINNSGVVTYKAEFPDPSTRKDILVSTSGTPLIVDGDYDSMPMINDSGTVVIGYFDGGTTTGVYNATTSSFIYDSTAGVYEVYSHVGINAAGTISFVADNITTFNSGVATATPLNTITDTGGPLNTIAMTDINDDGVVSYIGTLDSDGSYSVFTSESGTAIDNRAFIASAAINNNGVIVYNDNSTVLADAVTLMTSGTPFASFDKIALNNNNTIAVLGTVGVDGALYARSGPVLDKVIAANDFLNGNQVLALDIGPQAINDAGQIVFWAQSVQFSPLLVIEGIYVATPDFLLGDINVDGVIDVVDNLLLTQYLTGAKTPTPTELAAADMDQNAALEPADLLLHTRNIQGQMF